MLWAVNSKLAASRRATGILRKASPHPLDHRLDEAGMVEEHAQLVDLRRLSAQPPAERRSMSSRYCRQPEYELNGARDECQSAPDAVGGHLAKRVGQQRVPIAVAPVDRQLRSMIGQFPRQGRHQRTILLVDRTHAAEVVIVLGDFEHPLAGHFPAAKHVFQERQHVVRPLRPAERNDQNGVVHETLSGK